jgi:cation-transporting ATPase F
MPPNSRKSKSIPLNISCATLRKDGNEVPLGTSVRLAGAAAMLCAQMLFTYAPFMQRLFHTAPLDAGAWLRITGVTTLALAAVELEKWICASRRHSPGFGK